VHGDLDHARQQERARCPDSRRKASTNRP
jgi:hypothetical protein